MQTAPGLAVPTGDSSRMSSRTCSFLSDAEGEAVIELRHAIHRPEGETKGGIAVT
ncbi:hypothetical protein ABIC09_007283 [Bradyrhizobium sp. S3.12.5]